MKSSTARRIAAIFIFTTSVSTFAADWNKQLAANYLDSRQKAWLAWPNATEKRAGACVSCHTGLTFLQARPALRKALHEAQPSAYETSLKDAIAGRLDHEEPGRMFRATKVEPRATQDKAVESVVSAFSLATDTHSEAVFVKALDRMLATQVVDGKAKGGWLWFSLGLSPWEAAESDYYGASLAARALDAAPASYRARADVRGHVALLEDYLKREFESQPLHHRMFLLYVSQGIGKAVPAELRQQTMEAALEQQQADGSWTIASLGPWKSHKNAAASTGGDNYATAIVALALEQEKSKQSAAALRRGLAWLSAQQDPASGAWLAKSMNRFHEPESIEGHFMNEAATSYAVLALLNK